MEKAKTQSEQLERIQHFQNLFEAHPKIKVCGVDIDGILRGKIISRDKFFSCLKSDGGFGFCSVVFGWDMHDKTYQPLPPSTKNSEKEQSYGDVLAKIDFESLRWIPYEDNLALFLIDFHSPMTNAPLPFCPRGLLKRVMSRFENVVAMAGVEFEFFNFLETPHSLQEKRFMDLKQLTPGMFGYSLTRPSLNQDYFDDIFNTCLKMGIEIEGLHTETGPGVYEAALKYGDALRMADNAQLFKTVVKQIGQMRPNRHPGQPAIYPTFMAKPSSSLPGCSGHMHLSLMQKVVGKDGKHQMINLFYDENDEFNMSTLMKQFLAGLLLGLPDLLAIYAPTVNSYKRLVENYWAPVRVCWGLENRTAAVRVITPISSGLNACSPLATRIEMRVPGADINTHLAMAACFASGHYGIKHKLDLPPPVTEATQASAERLSKSLGVATEKMANSKVAREMLGDEFVDHYVRTRREEWNKWEASVTQYEVARYFELV